MSHEINLEIAGIQFRITCRDAIILPDSDPAYSAFTKTSPATADFTVTLKLNNLPDTEGIIKIFDSEQSWSMFRKGDDHFLARNRESFPDQPVWIAEFNRELTKIQVNCSDMFIEETEDGKAVVNPVNYPLDQILLMYILSQREGALFHAAGISINGRAYMFPGRSGAGKSTLTKLFRNIARSRLLSDDRIAVRKIDREFTAFGTPWPGEAGIAENTSIPLRGIFFLSHTDDTEIRRITPRQALERFVPVTSIPWYDETILSCILKFCEDLVANIPAYELCFRPDSMVTDYFEKFVTAEERVYAI